MKLGKGFVVQGDEDSTCFNCGIEQNIIDFPINEIPRKVLLHSIHGYDYHVFECPKCKQKSIQFINM